MNCSDVQEVLPQILGDDAQDEEFQAHLASCAACARLVADLELIASESHELAESDEPSPQLWYRIAAQLRSEGLIRESETVPARPVLVAEPRRRRWNPWWLVPVAACLTAGSVYFLASKPDQHTVANTTPASLAASQQAGPSSQQAGLSQQTGPAVVANATPANVTPEDQQLLDEVQQSAPMMRAAYENELRSVNSYIRDARDYADQNPSDEDARQQLQDAYEQKQMVYQLALEHVQ
jgi:hypothetical protein